MLFLFKFFSFIFSFFGLLCGSFFFKLTYLYSEQKKMPNQSCKVIFTFLSFRCFQYSHSLVIIRPSVLPFCFFLFLFVSFLQFFSKNQMCLILKIVAQQMIYVTHRKNLINRNIARVCLQTRVSTFLFWHCQSNDTPPALIDIMRLSQYHTTLGHIVMQMMNNLILKRHLVK